MLDDIKLNQVGAVRYQTEQQPAADKAEPAPTPETKSGVTVTHHLQSLMQLVQADHSLDDAERVLAAKNLIQSGHYSIDLTRLSEKLLDQGVV